jgi:DNA-binding transcriptional ArsR family regulator
LQDFLIIKDPEVAKLLGCAVRRGILHNLAYREMTPAQLAKVFDKPVSSIVHHLNVLEKAGLVTLARTVQRGNIIKRFYSATARAFVISYTLEDSLDPRLEDVARWSSELCRMAASRLTAFGYELPDVQLDCFTKLVERFTKLEREAFERVISRQTAPTGLEKPALKLLVRLLTQYELSKSPGFKALIGEISKLLEASDRVPAAKAVVERNASPRIGL